VKFISLFLSLFFAILVTVPCNDEVSQFSGSSTTAVEKKSGDSQHSDFDACSVFCTCSCCGIVKVLDQKLAEISEVKIAAPSTKISDFQLFTLSKIPLGIWQPPKLS